MFLVSGKWIAYYIGSQQIWIFSLLLPLASRVILRKSLFSVSASTALKSGINLLSLFFLFIYFFKFSQTFQLRIQKRAR